MKYGKTHAESELLKINAEKSKQMNTLFLLLDKVRKLEKRIKKLEKILKNAKVS